MKNTLSSTSTDILSHRAFQASQSKTLPSTWKVGLPTKSINSLLELPLAHWAPAQKKESLQAAAMMQWHF